MRPARYAERPALQAWRIASAIRSESRARPPPPPSQAAASCKRNKGTESVIGAQPVLSRRQPHDFALEFNNSERAVRPIILPADDHIALILIVTMFAEICGPEFKLDASLRPQFAILVM